MNWDTVIHLAEAVPLFLFLWRIMSKLTHLVNLLADFPLHRHINGQILYPRGSDPGRVERTNGETRY